MPAIQNDLVIEKGATFNETLVYRDPSGTLINLTGFTARMQIRETQDSADPIVDLTTGDGITLGGSAGTIQIFISDTDTSAIVETEGVYDFELISPDPDNYVDRIMEGRVQFKEEVTR